MTALSGWENFYMIVGSSAGALIGLQFVVITLIAEIPTLPTDPQAGGAFSTPSVVHFGVVLFLAAIASAPWSSIGTVAALWGFTGFAGMVYSVIVARRMRMQRIYKPVLEDWLFHVLFPLASYAMLATSAFFFTDASLFFVGAASLSLLFIGIHNAWDTVTHLIFIGRRKEKENRSANEQS
jgi:hypothetical protein